MLLDLFRENHQYPVDYHHKGPVTRNVFQFDDDTMQEDLCDVHIIEIWETEKRFDGKF